MKWTILFNLLIKAETNRDGCFWKEKQINNSRFFSINNDGTIHCTLCPHRCLLSEKEGICHVRTANNNDLELPYDACISALGKDPVEKKPLYHWRPGSSIVSAGFFGCNLRCPFCQNWSISQINKSKPPSGGKQIKPDELITLVKSGSVQDKNNFNENDQIAYTYSEPLVHAEYLLDCMKAARSSGIANILVTNGCVNTEAAEAVLLQTDAANIDLKCFSQKTYAGMLGGNLDAVLEFIKMAVLLGVHTEITTLVVPDMNDSEKELMEIAEFIAGLTGKTKNIFIPWHLSAYHPAWKWDTPPANPSFISSFAKKAHETLSYVYTGNIAGEQNDTFCSKCGAALVKRCGYNVDRSGICLPENIQQNNSAEFYCCVNCGEETPLRWN